MELHLEYSESQARRFMTTLFTLRAVRHLRSLGAAYGWTPDQLVEYERRFISAADMTPDWRELQEK